MAKKRVLAQLNGREYMQRVKEALAEAGLPRTSGYNGGELTGWTHIYGSTGFSVRHEDTDIVVFNVVISGKAAGLDYETWRECEGDEILSMHSPIRPESLCPKIRQVFEGLGVKVLEVSENGYQMHWDDDVNYAVKALRPGDLGDGNGGPYGARGAIR